MACNVEDNNNQPDYGSGKTSTSANKNANALVAKGTPGGSSAPIETRPFIEPPPDTVAALEVLLPDREFIDGLKAKLQLSNEQTNKLKQLTELSRANPPHSANSNQNAPAGAQQSMVSQIREAIGDDNAQRLFAMVGTGSTGPDGSKGGLTIGPGAVPDDTRIIVNIPEFRMDLFDSGHLIKSFKVGIGYPEFPLPIGLRSADKIIFNPPWTPPDSPWVEDMSKKIRIGKTVKPGDKLNPLGPLKVPIGLPALIHGGKAVNKIGTYASHGCVGLTNSQVLEFAKLLAHMGGAELTDEQIAEYGRNRSETQTVPLPRPVPVELRYDTIVVEDGKLHFYPDVYDQRSSTDQSLKAALAVYRTKVEQLNGDEQQRITTILGSLKNAAEANGDTTKLTRQKNGSNPRNISRRANPKIGKEIVVESPELGGKGYPAPADLDDGRIAKRARPARTGRKR